MVVSVGFLGLLATLGFGLRSEGHVQQMTTATYRAQHIVSLIRSNGWANRWNASTSTWLAPTVTGLDDADGTRRPLDAPPFNSTDFPANNNMTRNIQVTQGAGPGELAYVVRIRVRVFWKVQGHEHDVELVAFQRRP